MKRVNKIIIILVLPLTVELVISCCNCLPTIFSDYTNCSLTIRNLDNSGAAPIVTTSNTISKNSYGIRLSVSRRENVCSSNTSNSFFIQSVNATSCECPPEFQYRALDSIMSVRISTNHDFDLIHKECSDVTGLFYVFQGGEFIGIDNFVQTLVGEQYYSLDPSFEFDLLLMSAPTIGTDHEFEVSIELSDGRILNATTGLVKLE